jgi:hypothetical protein
MVEVGSCEHTVSPSMPTSRNQIGCPHLPECYPNTKPLPLPAFHPATVADVVDQGHRLQRHRRR